MIIETGLNMRRTENLNLLWKKAKLTNCERMKLIFKYDFEPKTSLVGEVSSSESYKEMVVNALSHLKALPNSWFYMAPPGC